MKYKGQKKSKRKRKKSEKRESLKIAEENCLPPPKRKKYVIALETKLHPLNRNRSYTCKKSTLIRKIPLKLNTQNNTTTTKIRRNSGRQSLKKSRKQNNKEKKVSNN